MYRLFVDKRGGGGFAPLVGLSNHTIGNLCSDLFFVRNRRAIIDHQIDRFFFWRPRTIDPSIYSAPFGVNIVCETQGMGVDGFNHLNNNTSAIPVDDFDRDATSCRVAQKNELWISITDQKITLAPRFADLALQQWRSPSRSEECAKRRCPAGVSPQPVTHAGCVNSPVVAPTAREVDRGKGRSYHWNCESDSDRSNCPPNSPHRLDTILRLSAKARRAA